MGSSLNISNIQKFHMRSSFNISNISYGKPFNISWQSVVLDFVPPSTFPAYRSPRPQMVQPSSPYCNTSIAKGKILTIYCNTGNTKGKILTIYFLFHRNLPVGPPPLRKFAQLKNFLPEHQRSEVSTVYLH